MLWRKRTGFYKRMTVDTLKDNKETIIGRVGGENSRQHI